MMDGQPRVAEIDFQRERLRRELSDVITLLDEATAADGTKERARYDLLAALRVAGIQPEKYIEAGVNAYTKAQQEGGGE
jgi:hypothetical protein